MIDRTADRLLFVIHYPTFGGPHNQALRLQKALHERGWGQVVVLPDEPGNAARRLRDAGVPVRTVPLQRLRAIPDARLQLSVAGSFHQDVARIRALIRELDAQLVMIGGVVNPHAAVAARLEGVPLVWQIVDTRTPMALRRLVMPMVERLADSVLCTGIEVARAHPGAMRLGPRLFPFFPPVDTEAFAPSERQRREARAELGLGGDEAVVGMVGNLNPQKGQETFIEAAACLRRVHSDVRFVLLGASYPQHEAYAQGLWTKAANLGLVLGEDLIVTDPGSRVAELASALDVFWLTSEPRSEGIPTVVEEAMSLGLPVVSTDVGSVGEAIQHGETGFVVPPRDAQQMAELTHRLLRDAESREAMGLRARRSAIARFGVEQCAAVHIAAFEAARDHAAVRMSSGRQLPRLAGGAGDPPSLPSLTACPRCAGSLHWHDHDARCESCGAAYPSADGVPVLLPPEADAVATGDQGREHKMRQMAFFDDEADPAYEATRPHGTPALHGWLLTEKFRRSLAGIGKEDALQTALTVCGGSGMDAEFLARSGLSVVSADISVKAAQRAAERSRREGLPIASIVGDVEHLPFADRSFDLVYVHDGLHHLEDPLGGLAEMARVARRAVVVTEPAMAAVTRAAVWLGVALEYEEAGNRVARVDPEGLAAALTASGFEMRAIGRYLMYYRHEAGWVARFLSRGRIRPLAQRSFSSLDRLLGHWGNKMALSAARNDAIGQV